MRKYLLLLLLTLLALSGCKTFEADKHSTTVLCFGFAIVHTRSVDIEAENETDNEQ